MERRVKFARLHANLFSPDAGELGTTLPPTSKTLENLSLVTDGLGLTVSFIYRGIKKELLVPLTNVVFMDLIPEEKAAKVSKST